MNPTTVVRLLLFLGLAMTACRPVKETTHYLSNAKTPEQIQAIENKVEKVAAMFYGEFSNQLQSDTATSPRLKQRQDFIGVPIWQDERKGEHWLYFGWFKHGESEHALGQMILKFSKLNRDTVQVTIYRLPNEKERNFYSEEWKKTKPFADLKPKDLVQPEGCFSYVVERTPNVFEFVKDPSLCHRQLTEVVEYSGYEGRLQPHQINLYFEYYDKNKKLVFNYQRPDGMFLIRGDKNKPFYADPKPKK